MTAQESHRTTESRNSQNMAGIESGYGCYSKFQSATLSLAIFSASRLGLENLPEEKCVKPITSCGFEE